MLVGDISIGVALMDGGIFETETGHLWYRTRHMMKVNRSSYRPPKPLVPLG